MIARGTNGPWRRPSGPTFWISFLAWLFLLAACGLPADVEFPEYPEAKYLRYESSDRGRWMAAYYVTPDAPGNVLTFYRNLAMEQGWRLESETTNYLEYRPRQMPGESDERSLVVELSLAEDGQTTIQVRRVRRY